MEQKFPTEIIELPSKGLLYPESSPLSSGTIELKIPTGKEENILSSKKLIKNNQVINRFLSSLIVNKQIKLNDLVVGDVSALIYAARILAYGAEYKVKVTCPVCNNVSVSEINLNDFDNIKIDEHILNKENEYSYTFEKSKITIKHKIMTHGDEEMATEELKSLKKLSKLTGVDKELTLRMATIITSIDGVDLPEKSRDRLLKIENILSNEVASLDLKNFRKHLKQIQPGINTTFYYECDECSFEKDDMEVVLDTNFF